MPSNSPDRLASLRDRAQEGRRLIAWSIGLNVVLALVKILGGWLGHSHALIADGVESSLDVLSALIMWWAIKYAERPPDSEHPYGHGKMESLAAVLGSLFLVGVGGGLGWHSLWNVLIFQSPTATRNEPAVFTLVILILTVVVKEVFFRFLSRRAAILESKALETDAMHHRSDAMTSLAAGIGITAALLGGPLWAVADDWAALFSCVLITLNGLKMLRGAVGEILDEQMDPKKVDELLNAAMEVPGVASVEKCRVRKSGFVRIADLHVRVSGELSVREGHRIGHEVQEKLLQGKFHLVDVTVHVEPEGSGGPFHDFPAGRDE